MNSSSQKFFRRLRRRIGARLAQPKALFLLPEGLFDGQRVQPFADWCDGHAGEAAEIIVSTRMAHELVCEPGLPLNDDAALQAYARQLFAHYYGAAAQRWPLATWTTAEQRGATALHGLDWLALRQSAAAADIELRRVRPAWAPLLQRLGLEEPDWLRAPQAALAWVEGGLLSWLQMRDGQLQGLRQLRLAEPTQAALGETLAELRGSESVLVAGYGLDAGATPVWPGVRVIGRLDAPQPELAWFVSSGESNQPQPDFLGPSVIRSRLAWPLAATGLLVLATAGWSAWGSHQQRAEAQERLATVRATHKGEPIRPQATVALSSSNKTAEQERLRSAAEVQGLLQQAWEPLLANVEQAGSDNLNWLGLDYSAGRNELRLEGLTQDKLLALKLVDRLAAAPGWRDVVLSRFQTGEQGLSGQRFELSAKLSSPLLKPELPAAAKDKP